MKIIARIDDLRKEINLAKAKGDQIGLVPTMGYLHEGHLSLIRQAKKENNCVVTTIFVNPAQFGPSEDFDKYPRDFEGDTLKAEKNGTDILFIPDVKEIYAQGYKTYIEVTEITDKLCGESRPGHFRGVATIVLKLFNIVKPHKAYFGEKDFQQLQVIRQMVKDLNLEIEIIGMPIIREEDGLAMSSRNAYLSNEERISALSLHESLNLAEKMIRNGINESIIIKNHMEKLINSKPFTEIDYISICNPYTFIEKERVEGETLIALAIRVGKTRLIDNRLFK